PAVSATVGDPARVSDQAAAAAGAADAARGVRTRPPYLSVLRDAQPRPDAGPCRAPASGRAACLGQPGQRLPRFQPSLRKADAGRGADAASAVAGGAAGDELLSISSVSGERAVLGLAEVHARCRSGGELEGVLWQVAAAAAPRGLCPLYPRPSCG